MIWRLGKIEENINIYIYVYMHIIAKTHTKFSLRGLQAFLSHRVVPSEETQQYQMLKLSQTHTKTQGLETEAAEIQS